MLVMSIVHGCGRFADGAAAVACWAACGGGNTGKSSYHPTCAVLFVLMWCFDSELKGVCEGFVIFGDGFSTKKGGSAPRSWLFSVMPFDLLYTAWL